MSPVCELRILALWIAGDYRNPAVYMQYMPDSAISRRGAPGPPTADACVAVGARLRPRRADVPLGY